MCGWSLRYQPSTQLVKALLQYSATVHAGPPLSTRGWFDGRVDGIRAADLEGLVVDEAALILWLREANVLLEQRLADLEAEIAVLGKNSSNSSRPPPRDANEVRQERKVSRPNVVPRPVRWVSNRCCRSASATPERAGRNAHPPARHARRVWRQSAGGELVGSATRHVF